MTIYKWSPEEQKCVPAEDQTRPEYTEEEKRRYCSECRTLDWRGQFPHKCDTCEYKELK